MEAQLDPKNDILSISQKIIFVNQSETTLTEVYLHNWPNGYRNKKSPLSRRLIEDYDKSLYFARDKDRGYIEIKNLTVNFEVVAFKELREDQSDILKILLNKPLKPGEFIEINTSYLLKIPNANFTGYGKSKTGYKLRYWYLIPAVFQNGW